MFMLVRSAQTYSPFEGIIGLNSYPFASLRKAHRVIRPIQGAPGISWFITPQQVYFVLLSISARSVFQSIRLSSFRVSGDLGGMRLVVTRHWKLSADQTCENQSADAQNGGKNLEFLQQYVSRIVPWNWQIYA